MANDLILTDLGLKGITYLRQQLDAKGLNASATLSNSFEVVISDSVIGIRMEIITTEGQRYWQLVNNARRPKGGAPLSLFGVILEWSRTKPISFADERDRRGFAAAVSRSITQEGTYMDWERDRRQHFATDALNSNEFLADETRAIDQIASSLIDTEMQAIFSRP